MKKTRVSGKICISLILSLLWASVFLSLTGCGEKGDAPGAAAAETADERTAQSEHIPTETVTEAEDLEPVVPPELDEGIITYFAGDVFILEGGEWWEAEIGETLTRDDGIKTEASSYCEIQFGETAVVRVQENTEISVRNIGLKAGEAQVGLEMKQGSVLSKVQKLSGSDRFEVRTQTAVCGVRGTEFSVSSDIGGKTRLAVREGAVSVLPATVDIGRLKEQTAGKSGAAERLIDEIERSAPIVEADREIDIDESLVRETEETAGEIEQAVREIGAAEDERQTAEKVENLQQAVERTKQVVARGMTPTKQISRETREALEEIDEIRILRIVPEEETSRPALIRLSVNVQPKDAVIELDGERVGLGNFSGLYPEGINLSFRLSSPGYREHILNVLTGADTSKAYTVKLGRLPDAEAEPQERQEPEPVAEVDVATADEKEPAAETEPSGEIEVRSVTVEASPGDAVITINGGRAGIGRASSQFEEGSEITIGVERKGYEPRILNVTVGEGRNSHSVRLEPKTVQTDVRITDAPLVGRVTSGAGGLFAADRKGQLIAANLDGDVRWRIETANTPNENSYPVLIGNLVYFSGAKELVIVEAASGDVLARIPLEGPSAHLFGRRVVPYRGDILFPTNEGIQIRDARSGKVKHEVAVPNGSRMTPTVWGETVIIANQQGALLMLDPYSDTPVAGNVPTQAVQPVALGVTVWADRAFFSGRKGTVACVDLVEQEVLWERKLPEGASVFTDISCDGRGLYAFSKGTLYALSVEDGSNLFPPLLDASSPAQCGGNRFYYGVGNALAVADTRTGNELRRIRVPGRIIT
ncbi:MAG: PQQ-binding-like beta-propeller repeat protein, partial [Spirochaetia bacterium]